MIPFGTIVRCSCDPYNDDPSTLTMTVIPIHETFQQTIQGEGLRAGTPADFIRLAGCPVQCVWCDTGYADGGVDLPRQDRGIDELIAELCSPYVVITGGEPFIHPSLPELVQGIEATGRTVAIETSGAFWQEISPRTWVTLSPKAHMNPRYPVQPQMWARANEFKLIISTGAELEVYTQSLSQHPRTPVLLQPEGTDLERTVPLVLDLLKRFPHYQLSLQLHKYLGVP